MIKVILTKKDDNVNKVIINGHAGYDDFGKDIVCAAVSSTVITTINILLSLDNQSISYNDSRGLIIEVLKNDMTTKKIINVLISNLYELEKAYPEFAREVSPTKQVGSYINTSLESITHEVPMMSLGDVFNFDELREFDEKIKKVVEKSRHM